MATEVIERIKKIIREADVPYFNDDEIQFFLDENLGDVDATIYQLLIVKSETSNVEISGLTTQDTSSYFKRLAQRYKKRNSGTLGV